MPSLSASRRVSATKINNAKTIGQIHKENSDFVMEDTWENDIQSKVCYLYDYLHDDFPLEKDSFTYENTMKTKIDAKFIISSYGSITKDQVAYHLIFKPSQPLKFNAGDDLWYFEEEYRNHYGIKFPRGLYCDIPNEKGVYERWLVINDEQGNQFTKYNVLPCNYLFEWVETEGQNRYKRRMWGVDRQQLSYDSGLYKIIYL